MGQYAVAVASAGGKVVQKIVEGEGRDAALRVFFNENMANQYSDDDQGYHYFKEDYFDPKAPLGSMLEV